MNDDPWHRIDRLESIEAIRQLPVRYAIAIDSRDIDGWLALFPRDVNCGGAGTGRKKLRAIIEPQLRMFYRSIHQICGHSIDLDAAGHATGMVYCRAEHEVGRRWIVMAIAYFDEYVRQDGDWYFARRRERHWYATEWANRPAAPFNDWSEQSTPPGLPQDFESWSDFWEGAEISQLDTLTSAPVGEGDG